MAHPQITTDAEIKHRIAILYATTRKLGRPLLPHELESTMEMAEATWIDSPRKPRPEPRRIRIETRIETGIFATPDGKYRMRFRYRNRKVRCVTCDTLEEARAAREAYRHQQGGAA